MPRTYKKPPIPPLSCPHIDRVIELTEFLYSHRNDENLSDSLFETTKSLILCELEFIREINDELRTASKFWYDKRSK